MANEEQVAILKRGVKEWNEWFKVASDVEVSVMVAALQRGDRKQPYFGADLEGADLKEYISKGRTSNGQISNERISKEHTSKERISKGRI